MKRINILLVLFVYALVGSAQNETKTIELGEVEIKAAKVISHRNAEKCIAFGV